MLVRWPGQAQAFALTFFAAGAQLDVTSISLILREYAGRAFEAVKEEIDDKSSASR